MKQINVKILLTVAFCLLGGYAFSQKYQKIPYINNILQYNVKEGQINKMRINAYDIKNDNGKLLTNLLVEMPVEITFDSLGNRVKEVVTGFNGKKLRTTTWDYNIENGTIGKYQLDTFNRTIGKKLFEIKDGGKSVGIKTFGGGDTLYYEERWTLGATGESIISDKYVYELRLKKIAEKTTKTYDAKGYTVEQLINEFSLREDYLWFANFVGDFAKSKDKNARVEKTWDNGRVEYVFDKKQQLYTAKNKYDKTGKLVGKTTYQYEFDGNGNWTKALVSINDVPKVIMIRTFEFNVKPVPVKFKK